MCILFLYINDNCDEDGYRMIIANNRDEFWDRPTKPAAFWEANDKCIGGLDQVPGREGGTWLGASKNGRIGILLNILGDVDPKKKGRGHLISNFLTSGLEGNDYIKQVVAPHANENKKFNLILINLGCKNSDINYFNNLKDCHMETVSQGIHVFDNSTPMDPWKKSVNGRKLFQKIIEEHGSQSRKEKLLAELLHMLSDKTTNENDEQLASQAIMENMTKTQTLERSAIFVFSPSLPGGTRTHTLVLIDKNNNCDYIEKTMKTPVNPDNVEWETNTYSFKMDSRS